jgi:hypothetical protein
LCLGFYRREGKGISQRGRSSHLRWRKRFAESETVKRFSTVKKRCVPEREDECVYFLFINFYLNLNEK